MFGNTIGRRLAGKNKHQPVNTLGSVRFGSARLGVQCECFHYTTRVCFPNESVRFGSARLGVQCKQRRTARKKWLGGELAWHETGRFFMP
jgi:hypothetical protein